MVSAVTAYLVALVAWTVSRIVITSPLLIVDAAKLAMKHPEQVLGSNVTSHVSVALDMANGIGFGNYISLLIATLVALLYASDRLRDALVVLLTGTHAVGLVAGLAFLQSEELPTPFAAKEAVWGAILAFGVFAIIKEQIDVAHVFTSVKNSAHDGLLSVALHFRIAFGCLWGFFLLANPDSYARIMPPAVKAALQQPAVVALAQYHGARLLALCVCFFFAMRHASKRELTVLSTSAIAYIVMWSNVAALQSVIPTDLFGVAISYFQLILIVTGVLSNEGALEWAEGGLKSARNALLAIFFLVLFVWIIRSPALIELLSSLYGTANTHHITSSPLFLQIHRYTGFVLITIAVALIYGDDETIRGTLGGLIVFGSIHLAFTAMHSTALGVVPGWWNGLLFFGPRAAMVVAALYALYHNVEGAIGEWLAEDVFAWSYTPLKGGLYGGIIVVSVQALVLMFAPHLLLPTPLAPHTVFLSSFLGVVAAAYAAFSYIVVRTAGPVTSYGLTYALGAYILIATHEGLVARVHAGLPITLRALLPALLALSSFVAGAIHDYTHRLHHGSHSVANGGSRKRATTPRKIK